MFQPIRCPACRAFLFEREGDGSKERIVCRCNRVLLIESGGCVTIVSDTRVAKQWREPLLVTNAR